MRLFLRNYSSFWKFIKFLKNKKVFRMSFSHEFLLFYVLTGIRLWTQRVNRNSSSCPTSTYVRTVRRPANNDPSESLTPRRHFVLQLWRWSSCFDVWACFLSARVCNKLLSEPITDSIFSVYTKLFVLSRKVFLEFFGQVTEMSATLRNYDLAGLLLLLSPVP